MTKVSVIIPAYNAAKFIRETLDCIFAQTYPDFEIIVVDDGSTDGTVDILKSYGDRVRWTVQNHEGQAYALNRGIGMATGEYLAYFDADDIMLPTKLEVQARYLDEHPEVDVVYSNMLQTEPGEGTRLIQYSRIDPFLLLQTCRVSRITIVQRRACVERIGLFNGKITGTDDWDMWVRMSERCRMAFIDQALSEYRIHGENISRRRRKPQNHVRYARLVIVSGACARRGKPLWLRMMVLSATIGWIVGKLPIVGERFVLDRVQLLAERLLLRWAASDPQPPSAFT